MSEQASSVPTPSLEALNTQESPQKSIEDIITSTGCDVSILEEYQDELKTINSTPEGKKQFEQAIQRELEKQSPPLPNSLIEKIIITTKDIVILENGKTVEETGKTVEDGKKTMEDGKKTMEEDRKTADNVKGMYKKILITLSKMH